MYCEKIGYRLSVFSPSGPASKLGLAPVLLCVRTGEYNYTAKYDLKCTILSLTERGENLDRKLSLCESHNMGSLLLEASSSSSVCRVQKYLF